jgi:AAHS family 4-hydroxybenzoate transporter-like MFS transporter
MFAETGRVGARQWGVLAMVLAALVIDGIDTQLLALVAPLIMTEWGVDKANFGPAMSAALFGMAIGAGAGGWLGDRLGRKAVLVGATLMFGCGTLAVAFAGSLPMLIALRLVSGLGFGALAPNGAALVSEWLPMRVRPRAMALLSITIPLGGLIGGSAVLTLLPTLGWRGCFMLCGAGTLAMAVAMTLLLPESPGYLAARGRPEDADRLLKRIAGPSAALPAADPARPVIAGSVFTRGNLRLNTGAWLAFFCLQLIAYAFLSWAPVFLTMSGWALADAIRGTLVFNLSAVCASLIAGFLLGRVPFRMVALGGAVGAAASLALLYALVTAAPAPPGAADRLTVFAAIAAVSILVGFGITAIYTLLSFAYPAACRASGIGIGLMTGRAGGIVSALTGGALLALWGDSLTPFFAVLLGAAIAAAVGILILGGRYAGRLRDIAAAAATR